MSPGAAQGSFAHCQPGERSGAMADVDSAMGF